MKPSSGSRVDSQASDSEAEAALVARVAAREQAAFAELYGLYRRRLARFLGRFLASSQTIDEIINDVMFVVWQDASRFELRSKVSTWIFGIAWHKALKALERQKREGPPLPPPTEIERPDDGGERTGSPGVAGPCAGSPVVGPAPGRRADFLRGLLVPGNRPDCALPRQHGEDPNVSCASPPARHPGVARCGGAGEDPMTNNDWNRRPRTEGAGAAALVRERHAGGRGARVRRPAGPGEPHLPEGARASAPPAPADSTRRCRSGRHRSRVRAPDGADPGERCANATDGPPRTWARVVAVRPRRHRGRDRGHVAVVGKPHVVRPFPHL